MRTVSPFRPVRRVALLAAVATLLLGGAMPLATAESGAVVSGVVTAANGAPIPNARVEVLGNGVETETSTDVDGRYLVSGLTGGTYEVTASSGGFVRETVSGVVLAAGSPQIVDFQLDPAGVLAVTVTDPESNPIPGALVSVAVSSGSFVSNGVTDGAGHFQDDTRPTGSYVVSASAPGFLFGSSPPIAVTQGATTALQVVLHRAGALQVTLLSKLGTPVPNAPLSALRTDGQGFGTTVSNHGDGTYTIDGLAPGTYTVSASPPLGNNTTFGYPVSRTGVVVSSGANAPLTLQLQEPGSLEGRVTTAGGAPVVGANVSVSIPAFASPARPSRSRTLPVEGPRSRSPAVMS
jgi:large repetitive protein